MAKRMQKKQNIVLVTQRLGVHETYEELRQQLSLEWSNFFSNFQSTIFLPVIYDSNVELLFETLQVSGIIFTGGNDVSITSGLSPKLESKKASALGSNLKKSSQNLSLSLSKLSRSSEFFK